MTLRDIALSGQNFTKNVQKVLGRCKPEMDCGTLALRKTLRFRNKIVSAKLRIVHCISSDSPTLQPTARSTSYTQSEA